MNSWIFQAKPERYDVQGYVSEFKKIYWSVGHVKHAQSISLGDEVFIWKAYGNPRDFAGVIAHGFIVEPPTEKQKILLPQNLGDNYWRGGGFEKSTVKVGVSLDDVRPTLATGALRRERLDADDILSKSQIIKVRNGTIFFLKPEQAVRLKELWSKPEYLEDVIPEEKEPKNPFWNREELLLALELYIQNRKSPPNKSSKEVESLSKELNQLRACIGGPGAKSLRNTAGVYLKMMNFRSYDPFYISQGKVGMRHGNKLEPAIWNEFFGKENELFKACRAIREALKELPEYSSDDSEDDGFSEAAEGRLLTRLHKLRERSVKLVNAKKNWAEKQFGTLTCEACGFDFAKVYGKRGHGFIECHHRKPVHELGDGHKTTTEDLALLCANCHRMIHRQRPWLSVEELKSALC